jgi:hypothetical protein
LTPEQEHNCKVVYKKSDDDEHGYYFAGLWSPEHEYDENHIIVPLRSVYKDTDDWKAGQEFANIIGSSNDPDPYDSWIQLFRDHSIPCDKCMTDGKYWDPQNPNSTVHIVKDCNETIGGHVTPGRFCAKSDDIKGSDVNLVPICKRHNSSSYNRKGNGGGFFMKLGQNTKVIILANYFQYCRTV